MGRILRPSYVVQSLLPRGLIASSSTQCLCQTDHISNFMRHFRLLCQKSVKLCGGYVKRILDEASWRAGVPFRILVILHFRTTLCQSDLVRMPGNHKLDGAALQGKFSYINESSQAIEMSCQACQSSGVRFKPAFAISSAWSGKQHQHDDFLSSGDLFKRVF